MAAHTSYVPLFETKKAKGSLLNKLFSVPVFVGVLLIWVYRATNLPNNEWFVWVGMLGAEIWFGFYWVLTQAPRWSRVYRQTFKDRLSQRYGDDLPEVDIFVCTADPVIEPPVMVINTVLSVMAYDYPSHKLAVYLSDDAASDLTFYALLECSHFAKHWIPYCKKYSIEPRAPEAYFRTESHKLKSQQAQDLASVKKLYREMENRIEVAKMLDTESKNAILGHKGFSKWDSFKSRRDHDTILQILIDRNDTQSEDIEGCRLPSLVYLAREKRPQYPHNYKAGAMNALIRVSSAISNAPIILNVDCDMYSNNPQSIKDALCFFLDEKKCNEIAYVQFPQKYHNLTKNDLYGASLPAAFEIELPGLDRYGGPIYIGTGCFHRRDTLCGRKFTKDSKFEWRKTTDSRNGKSTVVDLEEEARQLASCSYEKNTEWGDEMGLKYGCPVEDVITGLSIQCRGWKSVFMNPKREGFMGIAGTTLDQNLVQHKRWSEGNLQIMLSKYNPAWYRFGRLHIGFIAGYSVYGLWAFNCFATLYYSTIPSVYLLKGVPLFPQLTSPWIYPFLYVAIAVTGYNFVEFLFVGGTSLGWWNDQRMWVYKRVSSYLFGTVDTLLKLVGYSESGFIISAKVSDDGALQRYKEEKMEFGVDSLMVTIISSIAMLNLICFTTVIVKVIIFGMLEKTVENMALQIVLCGILVLLNLPLYSAALFRKDEGRLPTSVTFKSLFAAVSLCTCYVML